MQESGKFPTLGAVIDSFLEDVLTPALASPQGSRFLDRLEQTFGLPDLNPDGRVSLGQVAVEATSAATQLKLSEQLVQVATKLGMAATTGGFLDAEGNPRPPTHEEIKAIRAAKKAALSEVK